MTEINSLNRNITGYNTDSNARKWYKFPDGTLICTRSLSITISGESWTSGLFASLNISMGSFPIDFITTPELTYSVRGSGVLISGGGGGLSNSSAGYINIIRGSNGVIDATISYIAIGRWK